MINSPFEVPDENNNPLDLVEEFAEHKGWTFTRSADDYIVIQLPGIKGAYEVCMEWQDEFSALLFACSLPVEISDNHYEVATRTMEEINANLWLGHFDLANKGKYPTFRHTFLLRMIPSGIAVDLIGDVLEIAQAECNRFITTFQLVQAGDVGLQDNLHAAVFETVGEA